MRTVMVWAFFALASAYAREPNVTLSVAFPGNKDAKQAECQSWWVPTLLDVDDDTLLIWGCCKPADRNSPILCYNKRSKDGGMSWGPSMETKVFGQPVFSTSTGDMIELVGPPSSSLLATTTRDGCAAALSKYCPDQAQKKDACLACLNQHPSKFFSGGCTQAELSSFCGKTAPPCPPPPAPAPPPHPPRPEFARDLPQLTPEQLAPCKAGVIRSRDGGLSWSNTTLLNVNNSLGPHYIGNGLNHGIEIQNGPHKGRLVLALRFDSACTRTSEYMRSYVPIARPPPAF